ncbi:MAG: LacI family transcriptional regulator [Alicyclobacillus sp.]|nr:LacI family transcriptional regulator [Alicyclobacillus sp.]
MKPTIYDIAQRAGVSIATVSHVLNNTGRLRASTRQKVLRVIEELGYERNPLATALAGKNSYSIGFLIPDVNNLYFPEILRGLEDEAFRQGYSVLVCNTDNDLDKERAYVKTLVHKRMDGLIIATGGTPGEVIQELLQTGVRVTVLSREIPQVSVATVMVDNIRGGYIAAQHLLSLGHRRIGVITEPLSIASSRDRLRGFRSAVADEAPDAQVYVPEQSGFDIDAGTRMARELLTAYPITALFAVNDQLAVGAIQACRELGRRIPEDVSIIGFDDTVLAKVVHPPLTTVAQPTYELGRRAAALTIGSIESDQQWTETLVLKPELVVRASTCAPSAAEHQSAADPATAESGLRV